MTDDDIVPETLQRVSLAAGRSWDPAAMHAAQKAQDFRFFCIIGWKFCMFVDARSNLACTLLVVTPEN